jgi:hypothetical protein
MYVANPTLVGMDYLIDKRPSNPGAESWQTAAQHLAETVSFILPTGTTPGTALLEEFTGVAWIPLATVSVTFPNLAGGVNLASQLTLSLRDSNFTRPKVVVMEQNQGAPFKTVSPTGGSGGADSFVAEFTSGGTLGARPWIVMVNQHGFFLATAPFISFTTTYNRKLRRARGLA